jgi:hypothetical protein
MELGNIFFGNSRGNFPLPRGKWQTEFWRLDNEGKLSFYDKFENDVFAIFPYWWGDCTCGYDELEDKWSEQHKHTPECFITRLQEFEEELKTEYTPYVDPEFIDLVSTWAKENGYSPGWEGSAVHCDCGLIDKWNSWSSKHDHDPSCPIVRPNFLYKPTGFAIKWYKYPLRDSYSNIKISYRELRKIVQHCLDSLGKDIE